MAFDADLLRRGQKSILKFVTLFQTKLNMGATDDLLDYGLSGLGNLFAGQFDCKALGGAALKRAICSDSVHQLVSSGGSDQARERHWRAQRTAVCHDVPADRKSVV